LIEPLTAAGLSLEFTLTDRFPNVNALGHLAALYPAHIHFRSDPVDATLVPTDLRGLRTIFNAFHHFTPAAARAVLQNAVESRQPICIFEIPERSVPMLLPFLFTPVYVWIATPFIRPFRASRLLFTFLLPLVPLTCWWDGLVSAMRAYTVKEMLALTQDLDGFNWLAGRVSIPGTYAHVTWLRGIPTTSGNSADLADANLLKMAVHLSDNESTTATVANRWYEKARSLIHSCLYGKSRIGINKRASRPPGDSSSSLAPPGRVHWR
jgi:hypothetical protein